VSPPARAPLRVVQVAGSGDVGGGERYLEILARRVDRTRFGLEVVVPEGGRLRGQLEALGIPVSRVNLGRLVDPGAVRRLAALLRARGPAVVQSHGARSNFYTRLACGLAGGCVHVATVHNALRDYPVSAPRRLLYQALDRWTVPLSARVVCVAEALARDYGRRALVIPNGVELERFDPARVSGAPSRERWGLGAAPVVGFVGRLTLQKDPETWLRALARLRPLVPGVRGLVVGDGPLRGSLEALARALGLGEVCRFVGARPDVPELLAAMDVFVLSSVSEGVPFAVLEAMAMERAVVATAVSGVPEVIEPGVSGILVPPRDPAALAEAVTEVLRTPGRRAALGRAARARVLARFSADRMVGALEALWSALGAGAGRPLRTR
jgi:glycosyltransferase involved in cell wall biosynthesis